MPATAVSSATPPASTRFAPNVAAPPAPRRSKFFGRLVRWSLLFAVLGGLGYAGYSSRSMFDQMFTTPVQNRTLTKRVERSELLVTVTEPGNLESAANIDVKAHVAGGSVILWIVPDGTEVKRGELLVRLDGSTLEDQINQQRIVYERAVAARITAEKEFEASKIAVEEYIEGNYKKDLQVVEGQITVALENLRSSENTLEHTTRLARKGYVTPLQLDSQKFAVERAKLDLETARVAKSVLEKYTRVKMVGDLETKRDANEARMRSEQAACDLEQARLKRLQSQLENCTITAPQDGMVVYANETSSGRGGSQTVKIEAGASVRDQQSIVRLPDLSQMQVKVLVHESRVESLTPGLRAQIRIQDHVFQGEVRSIANQPEPTSFMSANVKEYATFVRIDGEPDSLKPGMTAEVEILVSDLKNVIAVPVQAVVEQGGKMYAWVLNNDQIERRPVVVGLTNNRDIEVKDGLGEGELVILNPRTVVPGAREEVAKGQTVDVASKFGDRKPAAAATPKMGPPGAGVPPGAGGPPGSAPGAAMPGGERKGPPGKSGMSLMQFDANGDGRLTADELPEPIRPRFSQLDTNGDGAIDAQEAAAARRNRPPAGPEAQ